jgi:uncharacterized protein YggU (UPF0235/DUF167 family)
LRADEIDLVNVAGGCRLRVRVRPGAHADAILGPHGGALKISVVAPPDRGRANDAVASLIAGVVDLPVSRVAVTAGHTSTGKTVRIDGMSAGEALARLVAAL